LFLNAAESVNMNELKLEDFNNELIKNPLANINDFIGRALIEVALNNVTELFEYDTQIVEKEIIFQVVDDHYLLLNKIYMKDFYFYWQRRFIEDSKIDGLIGLKSFCILMVNPNFASAWSRRKTILVADFSQVISLA